MTTVNQLLKHKGHSVWSVAPNASVYEALESMAEKMSARLWCCVMTSWQAFSPNVITLAR